MSSLNGDVIVADQRIGDSLQLKVFGDEFYARKETLNGYTVVYDTDKNQYCYADLALGHFISTGIPLHKTIPRSLRKHLKETPTVRNEKFNQRFERVKAEQSRNNTTVMRTLGAEGGLLSGRKLHQGDVLGLTVLVDFADVRSNISLEDVDDMFNADDYHENGNYCSVKKYFEIISSGKLTYTNLVVGPVTLSKRRSHYINKLLVEEAMDKVVNDFNIDLTQFDSKDEGIVDAINFLYAGESQYDGDLWPHNHFKTLRYGSMETHYYQLTGLGQRKVDLRIGTICHENGHLLCRFPDMYDYGKRDGDFEKSQGIGRYCLMGSGNHLDQRRTPAPVCGYLRELVGWVDNVIDLNVSGNYAVEHSQYNTVMKYSTDKANEYFIVENRTQLGLDRHLPSSGLAILHCDTLGSNELQDGTRNEHYQCALLQADGHLDLESNRNAGDEGDLFQAHSGLALSDTTIPSSREWDDTDSGLQIYDISEAAQTINFTVGTAGALGNIKVEEFPNVIIPDNNLQGISSTIKLTNIDDLATIKVGVAIIHSWISDLKVTLHSPNNDVIVLHNREGNDGDDIFQTWDSSQSTKLQILEGKPVQGDWTLNVQDNASADVGRLISWQIELTTSPRKTQTIEKKVTPNLRIPDNSIAGITSRLTQTQSGKAKGLLVAIDITHTYIGDLEIELVSPSGRSVLLHDKAGGSDNNIIRSYDIMTTPDLIAFVDDSTAGDWLLRVRDLARQDEGILNSWALKLWF